jgi:hypothetical protein
VDQIQLRALQAERSLIVDVLTKIKERELASFEWLKANAPDVIDEQRLQHCGASEHLYWHYGYAMALRDVMKMFAN